MFFLVFLGHFHHVEDICYNFREKDIRDLLWDVGVDETDRGARNFFPQVSSDRKLSSAPDRRYPLVRGRYRPPVQVGSKFDRHRVRIIRIPGHRLVYVPE